ncbi:MAG: sugar diacid recognition domain-containing protein [Sodalis sp. (in: enterobacteria)]
MNVIDARSWIISSVDRERIGRLHKGIQLALS